MPRTVSSPGPKSHGFYGRRGFQEAQLFAREGIPSAMLFIRSSHGSHNPKEHMELEYFEHTVEVLWRLASYLA